MEENGREFEWNGSAKASKIEFPSTMTMASLLSSTSLFVLWFLQNELMFRYF